MKEKTVEVPNVGTFVLRKPKAGPRNKAMVHAGGIETQSQQMQVMFELMPACVVKHPWDKKYRSVSEGLDDMESDEYDVLFQEFGELIKPQGDALKKSEQSSEQPSPEAEASKSTTPT